MYTHLGFWNKFFVFDTKFFDYHSKFFGFDTSQQGQLYEPTARKCYILWHLNLFTRISGSVFMGTVALVGHKMLIHFVTNAIVLYVYLTPTQPQRLRQGNTDRQRINLLSKNKL